MVIKMDLNPLDIIKSGTINECISREEYMKELQKWCVAASDHYNQTAELWQKSCYSLPQFHPSNENRTTTRIPTSTTPFEAGYHSYSIPPMWKRFVAELIDFLILFVIKMLLTILLIENFDLLDFGNYNLSTLEEQLQNPVVATKLTLQIIILEILHRIIVCIYEAYWLALEGTTPGKKVMGLAVICAVNIIPPTADAHRVLVNPCTILNFKDALLRAVLKNVFVGLLFPICFVLLFFKHNRTGYDILTNSLVVEHNTNLPLVE